MISHTSKALGILTLIGALNVADPAAAGGKKAHVHGAGNAHIAIEKAATSAATPGEGQFSITLRYELPAETIFGFEHAPKNAEQQQKISQGIEETRTNSPQWAKLDAALGCVFGAAEVTHQTETSTTKDTNENKGSKGHKEHGAHSDIVIQTTAKCQKDPAGSKLTFDLWKQLPRLKSLNLQIIGEKVQKGGRATAKKPVVDL
jgi:hypothetical protein